MEVSRRTISRYDHNLNTFLFTLFLGRIFMLQGTSCKREIKMKCLELDFHTFKPFHKLEQTGRGVLSEHRRGSYV